MFKEGKRATSALWLCTIPILLSLIFNNKLDLHSQTRVPLLELGVSTPYAKGPRKWTDLGWPAESAQPANLPQPLLPWLGKIMECADLGRYHRRENFHNSRLLKGKVYWNPCHWSKIYVIYIYIYTHTPHTHIYIYIYIYQYNLNDFGCKTYRKRTLPKPPLHTSTVHGTELSSNGTSPTGEKESKEWVSGYPRCMEHARRKPFLSSSINSTVLIPAVLTPSTVLMWGPPWLGGLPLWLSW